jgi:uncharacterized protein (TIGR04255 family)
MIEPMSEREIYPNAPLRFVAFEARFPPAPPLAAPTAPDALRVALRDRFPRAEPANLQSLEIGPAAIRQAAEVRHRFLTKDRTMSATIGSQTLTVEATSYVRYESFRECIEEASQAVEQLNEVAGLLRVGLRYMDEVRLPEPVSSVREWGSYMHPALTASVEIVPGSPVQLVGMIETSIADGRALVVRYGSLPRGRLVDPNGPLRIPHDDPDDQPFFFVDIDSYWNAPDDDLPAFETPAILRICDDLHGPTREVFENSIGEGLRAIFRQNGKGG